MLIVLKPILILSKDGWTFQTWSHSILLALKSPHSRPGASYNKAMHMPQDTSPSPQPHTHPELAACLWSNNQKGREVTLDEYWVNGLSVVSGGFLKITLTLLTAQVPSHIAREWGSLSCSERLVRNLMLPQRRGTWWRNTGYNMSRGLQFVTISDKPKCKENRGMLETDSKPGHTHTHTEQ